MIQPQMMVPWVRVIVQTRREKSRCGSIFELKQMETGSCVEKQRPHKNAPRFFDLREGMDFLT